MAIHDIDLAAHAPSPRADTADVDARAHIVQFYESDTFLEETAADFLAAGLRDGEAAIVIATSAHADGIESRLRGLGVDLAKAREDGRYVAHDASETLGHIMVGASPDEGRFREIGGNLVTRAARTARDRRVRVFGEMVALLYAAKNHQGAVELERLWNGLGDETPFALLCAYPIGAFRGERDAERFWNVGAAHARVIPAESYITLPTAAERLRTIAVLQQKASALDLERGGRRLAEETRARLAAIVECSDDAIVGKTLDGIVTSWNRGAERIFGYSAAEMIGQPISRLHPADRPDDFSHILDTVRRGDRVEHFETERIRKDGRRINVSLTVSPIKDAEGRIIGVSKIARDVTDRKQADAEREALLRVAQLARAEAESANRAKDEFLAMLAHELRTPLAAVRSAVVSAKLDDRRRDRALDIARRQTDQLARLVDDLLDVSRITQGRIVLRKERLYVSEVIERAIEATRSIVEDRGHTLAVSLPPDNIRVEGDATRLEQVIVNLLSNATKYTGHGGRIELLAERDAGDAVIRVRDSGIGITADMLPRVFDLFVQAERGLDRAQGGLGIGLTLVRSLVAMHGGRVAAYSEGLGKGAEFVVRLPALPPASDDAALPSPVGDSGRRARARVVLVEDNPDAAESLSMLLELLGHHVRVVHDGIAALEVAPANPPDVMLVDIGLPGMNGYEVARRVRQHPGLRHVVLVALTGYGRDEDRAEALEAGFDYHLVKPVDPNALEGLVARLGNIDGGAREAATIH